MARAELVVPASDCTIEQMFSISGRIVTWQRNRLNVKTISDTMIYRDHAVHIGCPLKNDVPIDSSEAWSDDGSRISYDWDEN
jgi:hypothetical protein